MKKIAVFLIAVFILLTFAACGGSGGTTSADPGEDSANEVQFNGDTIKLTYETNHYDLHYKENIVSMNSETMGSFCNITYRQDGDVAFEIRLVYFENKSIDEVMAESEYTLTDKTVNGLTYRYFEYDDNGRAGHTYVYCYDGSSYTISFASAYDMTSLEAGFLGAVRFAKE